jgi:hypothetical protein
MPPHLLRCQGIAVAYYSFTLGRLEAGAPSTLAHLGFKKSADFNSKIHSMSPKTKKCLLIRSVFELPYQWRPTQIALIEDNSVFLLDIFYMLLKGCLSQKSSNLNAATILLYLVYP